MIRLQPAVLDLLRPEGSDLDRHLTSAMSMFSDDELDVVRRFLTAIAG